MEKRTKVMGLIGLVFSLVGLFVFLWWLFSWRYEKSTKDSYVHGNPVVITPQVMSYVTSINTEETLLVEEGQVIIELEKVDYETNYTRASGHLADVVRQVVIEFEKVDELKAQVEVQKAILQKNQIDYEDRQKVVSSGAVSKEDLISAESAYEATLARIRDLSSQLRMAISFVKGTTVATHPMVLQAKEQFIEASIQLERCTIRSPATGIVAQRGVQVGSAVRPGDFLMAVVPLDQIWVEANFKETQLSMLKIGQSVHITSDIYGPDVVFHGTVYGIGAGTGAVFSLLPPQEATGNWIKITQRLPVRISLNMEEIRKHPLRLGLSMHTHVDIRDQYGQQNPTPRLPKPIYTTNVFAHQGVKGKGEAEKIIAENNTLTQPSEEYLTQLLESLE